MNLLTSKSVISSLNWNIPRLYNEYCNHCSEGTEFTSQSDCEKNSIEYRVTHII